MATFDDLPPEILRIVAQLIYLDHLPRSLFRCIDPHGLPSTYPDGRLVSSTQGLTKSTLHALCLTNSRLYLAARPLLWRRLQITLPYSFLLLLRTLGVSRLAEAYEQLGGPQGKRLESDAASEGTDVKNVEVDKRMSFNAMLAAVGLARVTGGTIYSDRRIDDGQQTDGMDLVWEEESTSLLNEKPTRFEVSLRQDEAETSDVHRYPRVLDFSTFTTQGMRRTVGEGEEARFVTPAKLLALITAVSHGLMAFGASPTMDSALTVEVLEALLFREGEHLASENRSGTSPHRTLRGVSIGRSRERSKNQRRRLESLDFCNCTSRHFEVALSRFIDKYLRKFSGRTTSTVLEEGGSSEEDEGDQRGRGRSRGRDTSRPVTLSRSISTNRQAPSMHPARATQFPSVERLCLHGVHFSSDLISPFVLAFPRLTHLDLTGTKIDDGLLRALSANADLELESLSLARCPRITSECLTELLVDSPACSSLIELSLEGTLLFPTPLSSFDLESIITMAPCMRSGSLRYLDISGCGLTDAHLAKFPNQPSLIDLGVSASPQLTLEATAEFLKLKAPNVQVLEAVDSFHAMRGTASSSVVKLYSSLLGPCSEVPQPTIAEQIAALQALSAADEGQTIASSAPPKRSPPTNLRVLGLDVGMLHQIGGALATWRVIMGKGRRGWLVDVSSGPDPDAVDQDLIADDDVDEGRKASGGSISTGRGSDLRASSIGPILADQQRGREVRRTGPALWEPETPPRRASRSPSVKASLSRHRGAAGGPSSLLRRAASSSHSRPRHEGLLSPQQGSPLLRPVHAAVNRSSSLAVPPANAEADAPAQRQDHTRHDLPKTHARRLALEQLSRANGHVAGSTGWHSKKMEVLLGLGMLGREAGSYAYAAYQA